MGEGKIYWAKRFSEENGVDIGESYLYTDSASDISMLRLVGNPIVVNPDHILSAEARSRGWRIIKSRSLRVKLKR